MILFVKYQSIPCVWNLDSQISGFWVNPDVGCPVPDIYFFFKIEMFFTDMKKLNAAIEKSRRRRTRSSSGSSRSSSRSRSPPPRKRRTSPNSSKAPAPGFPHSRYVQYSQRPKSELVWISGWWRMSPYQTFGCIHCQKFERFRSAFGHKSWDEETRPFYI